MKKQFKVIMLSTKNTSMFHLAEVKNSDQNMLIESIKYTGESDLYKSKPQLLAIVSNDKINKGDVLCIIEAMKVMNEIQSDISGELVEILVEDGVSVEFGQALYKIRPS